jgi:hypothetical protein
MDFKKRVPFGRTGLMEDNLKALDAGPLDKEEMARVRRIGKHIYDTAPKTFME